MEKSNNVANKYKEIEKIPIKLVGTIKKVVFLLKCVIFLIFFFGSILLANNW